MADKQYSDWEIIPLIGLGHLRFGMTSEEVGGFDKIYGKHDGKPMERRGIITEYRQESMLRMDYMDNKLIELQILWDMRFKAPKFWDKLRFDGKEIPAYPQIVVRRISKKMEEPPVAKDDYLIFPRSCVYMYNYTEYDYGERATVFAWVHKFRKSDPAYVRSVSWRAEPHEKQDYTGYVEMKVTGDK
ncbi:hypothetical protein [Breznakiella homolactica]|uniref:Uncharacterized protein n=1 Tax=Breznakiella homolactica TaxID=2798577 RepID=A0A7T7XJM9_9SPIR|nr:hypothetical protein [Breznakiella homolactica]QQO07586.1 hypothetical protein JFL75_11575 [Breznakiella homolactica]